MLGKKLLGVFAVGTLMSTGPAMAAANFDGDVAAAIDRGLGWFDTQNCYQSPFTCGEATGLAALALLEKRPSADAAPQGYSGASAADQARMRRVIRHIIDSVNAQGNAFYSYRDGGYMMALSVYMRSGGPDKDDGPTTELDGAPLTLKQALDKLVDRTVANQRVGFTDGTAAYPEEDGYWCYTDGSCRDSSTTQLVVAGLASARAAYLADAFADPMRLAAVDASTKRAREAYEKNGVAGDTRSWYVDNYGSSYDDPQYGCGKLPGEKGHGYNAGDPNSIQQTASGLWIQLVGGAGLNWPNVQSYMRWIAHRYRYNNTSVTNFDAGWGISYWYYLWSSFKAYQFLIDSKATPAAGNIGVENIGNLPAASDPACPNRQVHIDPASVAQTPLAGSGAAGYYGDETARIYFDYAYTIMSHQCASGDFGCNGAPSYWNQSARNAYALLVLQRSVGGGCLDADGDKICDSEDPEVEEPPVPPSGGLYCDANGNGTIDNSDLQALTKLLLLRRSVAVTPTNAWADIDGNKLINATDMALCIKAKGDRSLYKYY